MKGAFVAPPDKVTGPARKPGIRALLKQSESASVAAGGSLNGLRVLLNREGRSSTLVKGIEFADSWAEVVEASNC